MGLATADLRVDNSLITYKHKFTQTPGLFNFFGNANKYPHAVLFLYAPDGLPDIKLSQQVPHIKVTEEIRKKLQTALIDMVVYGRRATNQKCEIFELLHQNFVNRDYILRELDVSENLKDYSINRCTIDSSSFLPEKFKIGQLTPRAENDCTGTK